MRLETAAAGIIAALCACGGTATTVECVTELGVSGDHTVARRIVECPRHLAQVPVAGACVLPSRDAAGTITGTFVGENYVPAATTAPGYTRAVWQPTKGEAIMDKATHGWVCEWATGGFDTEEFEARITVCCEDIPSK